MTDFVCIGVPYYIGERIPDRTEVEAIKTSGLAAELNAPWVDIAPDFASSPDAITAVNRALAATVAAHSSRVPLVFASDCVSALGTMKGLERHRPAILWYDAHGDFNTPETTPSGFLGGMPLAMLVGRGDLRYMEGVGLKPVSEKDVIISDARDLDPEEGVNLRASEVHLLARIDDLMMASLPAKPIYLHFDTDVVDSAEMPAMNYPVAGGPSLEQTAATVKRAAHDAQVVGALFSLWNDTLAGADRSRHGTLRIVRALVEGMS